MPWTKTAKYEVNGTNGVTTTLTKITIKVDFRIWDFEFEYWAIREIKKTAAPPTNNPVKGILKACKIPPRAASLNPQSAVSLFTFNEFDFTDE